MLWTGPSGGIQMSTRLTAAVLLMLACGGAAASGLYDAVNRLRSGACATAASGAERLRPLAPQAALEQSARSLSQGRSLDQSLKASGYRATRWFTINIYGSSSEQQTVAKLRSDFCAQLRVPEFSDIGIYDAGQKVWIVLAVPFAPPPYESKQLVVEDLLALVNLARAQPRVCGTTRFRAVGPVRWNATLARVSLGHARDMARHSYFSHEGRDGSSPDERVARAGYRYHKTGENIASGQMTPEDAVAGWLKSPAHCANLMDPAFNEMGAAFSVNRESEMGVYWVQVFGLSG